MLAGCAVAPKAVFAPNPVPVAAGAALNPVPVEATLNAEAGFSGLVIIEPLVVAPKTGFAVVANPPVAGAVVAVVFAPKRPDAGVVAPKAAAGEGVGVLVVPNVGAGFAAPNAVD